MVIFFHTCNLGGGSLPARILVLFSLVLTAVFGPSVVLANEHADRQLAVFSESRPEAGDILFDNREIYSLLEKAFSGIYTSVPLAWNHEEPQGNAYAENTPSTDRSYILIRVSSKLCALDQVAALVYETINAQNEEFFADLCRDAYTGSLSKSDFIHGILRYEHKSLKDTREFLASMAPYKDADLTQTEFYRKMYETPADFDSFLEYLGRIKRDNFDIFTVYSQFYDFARAIPLDRKIR